ncbi:uncharacterized protein LOC131218724 isoform X1 [Magnolia sinica]|uniref:uncharacterized protein LOC131218724 isoform X1 n=1 Tax=Magnolia sinica TaxID=86752 RepID=UPI002657F88C|nr:uncharacterized protein LOC131218724 isoform X1 [Magnolia sinica]
MSFHVLALGENHIRNGIPLQCASNFQEKGNAYTLKTAIYGSKQSLLTWDSGGNVFLDCKVNIQFYMALMNTDAGICEGRMMRKESSLLDNKDDITHVLAEVKVLYESSLLVNVTQRDKDEWARIKNRIVNWIWDD